MAIILPSQNGLAESLGTALGAGISNYTAGKLEDLIQRNQRQQTALGLQGLFDPQKAQQLSNLPIEILQPLVAQQSKVQAQIPTSAPGLRQIMPELSDQEAEKIGSLTPALQTLVYRNYLDTPPSLRGSTLDNIVGDIQQKTPVVPASVSKPLIQEQQAALANINKPAMTKEQRIADHLAKKAAIAQPEATKVTAPTPETTAPAKPKTVAQLVREEGMSVKEAKEAIKEEKKAELLATKESKEIYENTLREAKAADSNDERLRRMEKLINEGKFGIPVVNSLIKSVAKGIFGFGLDLTSLLTADAQEFDKLSTQFAAGAKDIFPGRVTNADLDLYMRQIPTLSQSKAGMRRVIRSMKSANEAARLRKDAMVNIIKKNGGKRPMNLELLIEEAVGPQLDLLAYDFINAPRIPEEGFGSGIWKY